MLALCESSSRLFLDDHFKYWLTMVFIGGQRGLSINWFKINYDIKGYNTDSENVNLFDTSRM